jgi:hypothetical protein
MVTEVSTRSANQIGGYMIDKIEIVIRNIVNSDKLRAILEVLATIVDVIVVATILYILYRIVSVLN